MLAFPTEDKLQEMTLKDLKKEKKTALKEIKRYEKGKIPEEEWSRKPSPKLIYDCTKEYLETLEKVIAIKKNNR